MTTHAEAREFARQSMSFPLGAGPSLGEIKALCGVAYLETCYGDGWKGAGKGSNNMGAVQCGAHWSGARFSYIDTHPNADGTSTPYQIDFRKYSTPLDGWCDLESVVFVNRGRHIVAAAADRFDWHGVSAALHQTGYYEGFGKTVSDRINNHYRSLVKAITAADNATAPPLPVVSLPKTVRFGDHCEEVGVLQTELRLAADRIFGRVTAQHLIEYQREHGLVADGICGPQTWECLFGDDYTPEIQW
jgi:peptidoglycan hydrolase-like protein with peptidoglycan-binding domain